MGNETPRGRVYVAGTCDTKGRELAYVRDLIAGDGAIAGPGRSVHLRRGSGRRHRGGRGRASPPGRRGGGLHRRPRRGGRPRWRIAFARYILTRDDVAGLIGLGGSGNTALVTPAMQALPVGVPKLMVSTVASGNVAPYVGPSDIAMMYSVTDIAGLNRISRRVLANAAHAIAGMARADAPALDDERPALGITMFGVTTPCVTEVARLLERDYDCLVFHATGTGGASMEKLADSEPARRHHRRDHYRGRRHAGGRRAGLHRGPAGRGRAHAASLMSARAARSTWSISAHAAACRRSSTNAACMSTTRR